MTTATQTQDVPLATVSTGPTEIAHYLTWVASVLTVLLGQDYGLSAHIQNIAAVGAVVLPIALGFIRSHKHKAVVLANAEVMAANALRKPSASLSGAAYTTPIVATTANSSGYAYTSPSAPVPKHAAEDEPVGADLPVTDLTQ